MSQMGAYQPGELRVVSRLQGAKLLKPDEEDSEELYDKDNYEKVQPVKEYGAPLAFLPHSCDEWIIGGPEEVKALIADLQAALAVMSD